MKMIELTKEQFDDFAKGNPYNNYCQTSNYGMVMAERGYDYSFVGYVDNNDEVLAAGMFLTKKIGSKYFYAYSPKGFIIDYDDEDLLKKFTTNLIKYYKRKKVVFLKINPEIPIAEIDYNNDYKKESNENTKILDSLKSLGFKKRKELEPLQLLEPKLKAIIDLKNYDLNKLEKDVKSTIKLTENKGLEIEVSDASKIDFLYDFIKDYEDKDINYFRNLLNSFKKTNQADLILVKINYEKYLISSKKRVEEEQEKNEKLNEKLQKDASEKNLNEKMKSDTLLEEYKQDVVYATQGLKKHETTYIAGAIVIKLENKVTLLTIGDNKKYSYLNANYYLLNKIFDMYKDEYEIADINAIADDFKEESEYSALNKLKLDFKPNLIEFIGELDLIISAWRFKLVENNNLLSSEFTKKKDT